METEVLITGAGPTGLALALWLTRQGIRIRIIDKRAAPGTTSRALAVQARTLELYRQLDLSRAAITAGHPNPSLTLWAGGKKKSEVPLQSAAADLTPFPFVLIYPQDEHERLLESRLAQLGITVERNTELLAFDEHHDGVDATLRLPDGRDEHCRAAWLAGCDGASSTVRHQLRLGFPGGTYAQVFYVADIEGRGAVTHGGVHVDIEEADFVAIFSLKGEQQMRLVGIVRDERAERPDTLTFDDISDRAVHSLGLQVEKVHWFSTYRVHHRVVDHFRHGRVFLLGDAAHVHSPAGGQGMNTGIGDAVNLAWKLAAVLRGDAPESLLDSYEHERRAFALKLVATTDRVFSAITAGGQKADFIRTHVFPLVAGVAYSLDAVRRLLFRTISQLDLAYPDSPLSAGDAGKVRGGDRLPWLARAESDNHASLCAMVWQVHVYGEAHPDLRHWCAHHHLPLHQFTWDDACHHAGLKRDALYLLRPDTYVALADRHADVTRLAAYWQDNGFRVSNAKA
ncbi:FAD-dependent oxidoreductase [Chimaeribacter californicus]|uniref:FAD-dependent oxidoreductase n=1 Tax=Chimaeribacter californicus TaxID=2060067 RepID=A0A2N5DU75_9GAMM|nr:FAD-dependent monooxygenase [Chimaeribacter californicus]PLR30265.1 FAD-dependent oxidoreductase [Chimaeribacter californicus]